MIAIAFGVCIWIILWVFLCEGYGVPLASKFIANCKMIDLKNILSHLPVERIQELEIVTQRLAELQGVEIVILFGSFARGDFRKGETRKKSDYDILVVVEGMEQREQVRALLQGEFEDIETVVQLVVEDIERVNGSLKQRQFFFYRY